MDGGAAQTLGELCAAPAKQLGERRGIQVMTHLEIRVAGGARELVPRTHQLAVIAAEDAIADPLAQLHRDRAVVLDGEIGNAAARIEAPGRNDRPRRAGGDARLGGATVRARRLIERERQNGEQLPEEEPRAALTRDEVGVLADPAETGVTRERLLEH